MFSFCIKKNFYDGWDNILLLAVVNLLVVFLGFGIVFLATLVLVNEFAFMLTAVTGTAVLMIPCFAFGQTAARIAAFKSPSLKDFFAAFKDVWRDALLFGALLAAVLLLAGITIPFYLSMHKIYGFFLAAVLFWLVLITLVSLQWFIPLRFLQPNNTFRKCLKKSFIIFFDNPVFSLGYLLYQLSLAVLSVFLLLILPSVSGIILAQMNALRIRLYKYDWLETQTDGLAAPHKRAKVPWAELIVADNDTLGHRSLKSFIFPWKD